ncbi:MAG: prephenate dehydrogenase [Pirellulales bacterium]
MKTFDSITIVGVGLIGASIGRAALARNVAGSVIGTGSRPATLEAAQATGAITEIITEPAAAVANAHLVVICAPVNHIVEQAARLARYCRAGTLITDAGSTKARIVAEIERAAGGADWGRDVRFVGSHPLAGNEKRGPRHASADLFAGRVVVVTPGQQSRAEDVEAVSQFWTALGSKVVQMTAEEHDQVLAAISHLPHLAAAAVAGMTPERYVPLTAGGWQDTTRIAAGDPVLWRQILLDNRANVLESLDRLTGLLAEWRAAIERDDAAATERLLAEAKRIRDTVGN